MTTPTHNLKSGHDSDRHFIHCFRGGPTSAAKMNAAVGRRTTHKVPVEDGKYITWTELLTSFNQAAEKFFAMRGKKVRQS